MWGLSATCSEFRLLLYIGLMTYNDRDFSPSTLRMFPFSFHGVLWISSSLQILYSPILGKWGGNLKPLLLGRKISVGYMWEENIFPHVQTMDSIIALHTPGRYDISEQLHIHRHEATTWTGHIKMKNSQYLL